MITLKEIANELHLSTATVSNVIRGKTSEVSQETIDRVNRFLKEVDYVPNITARNLAQNQSRIIGIVIKSPEDRYHYILEEPFVSQVLSGVERVLHAAGYYMMLYTSDDIAEILRYVNAWNVDGLLLFWMKDDDTVRIYHKYRKPVVCIDSYIQEETVARFEQLFANVGLQDEQASYEAASYLIGLGHRRIGFASEELKGVDRQRFRGYRRALEEHGIEYSDRFFYLFQATKSEMENSMRQTVRKAARNVTALMFCADQFAAIAKNACMDEGIRVPEDLSIFGFDDTTFGRLFRLTTMHQDIPEKGRVAAETLLRMVEGKPCENNNITFPARLIVRESTAPPAKE